MGKFTAKVYAIKDDNEIEIKNLDDFEKYSTGYKYGLKEMSTTGGGAGAAGFTPGEGMGYATPYAFTGGKKAKEPLVLKKLGYKLAKNE